MRVEINKSEKCVVRIGPLTRSDPDAELHIVHKVGDEWERHSRRYIEGKKIFKFSDKELPEGEYHVAVFGDKIAGVATTGGKEMPYPFDVFLEAPEDHSKDYMRIDVPTDVPVTGDLESAIKAALRDSKDKPKH